MSKSQCHVHGCESPTDERQVELRVPLDENQSLSQLTVRTYVCTDHRRRFSEAGLLIEGLTLAQA
jgi:hypothetical protein